MNDNMWHEYIDTIRTWISKYQTEKLRPMDIAKEAGRILDEKINRLTQDCKNLVKVNNNQTDCMKSRDEEIKELKQHLSIIENTCIGLHFPAAKGSLEMHKYIEAMSKIEKLEKILKENT